MDEEWRKIFTDLLTETSRKHYGSTSTQFFFTKTCSLSKIAEMHSLGIMNILQQPPPSPIYREKWRCLLPRASWGRFLSAPQLLSSPPFSYFTEKLWKCFGFDFHLSFSSLSPMLSEICLPKVFWNFMEALRKPRKPFFKTVEELATQLLPP